MGPSPQYTNIMRRASSVYHESFGSGNGLLQASALFWRLHMPSLSLTLRIVPWTQKHRLATVSVSTGESVLPFLSLAVAHCK